MQFSRFTDITKDLHLRGKRVPLSPIRRALYQHFLLHPKGVRLYDLSEPHHLQSITRLYQRIATAGTPRYQAATIRKLVENKDGRLNQHLSVIRRTLAGAVGQETRNCTLFEESEEKNFGFRCQKTTLIGRINAGILLWSVTGRPCKRRGSDADELHESQVDHHAMRPAVNLRTVVSSSSTTHKFPIEL